MTADELKAKFQTGDIPTETDFSNLIDEIFNRRLIYYKKETNASHTIILDMFYSQSTFGNFFLPYKLTIISNNNAGAIVNYTVTEIQKSIYVTTLIDTFNAFKSDIESGSSNWSNSLEALTEAMLGA